MVRNKLQWQEQHLIFIGFMGVGKTTVGKQLASKVERDFIDLDQVIEEKLGMSIPAVFEKHGEPYFRNVEKEMIEQVLKDNGPSVISLGGGAYLQKDIRELCLNEGIVIFLDLSWKYWLERLEEIKDDRPVLKNKTIAEMKELYEKRYPIYSNNHLQINLEDKRPTVLAEEIIELLQNINS